MAAVDYLMQNPDLRKHVLKHARPDQRKVGLKFKLRKVSYIPNDTTLPYTYYIFNVSTAPGFWDALRSPLPKGHKKQKICNICSLLFKMKLLKSRRMRQFNGLEEVWRDAPEVEVDIHEFIERHINEWKLYIKDRWESKIDPSKNDFNYQVDHEGERRGININEYRMIFGTLGYAAHCMPDDGFPCFEVHEVHDNSLMMRLGFWFLQSAINGRQNRIGYVNFSTPERIKDWFLDYAYIIGNVICTLINRRVDIRGIPVPYNEESNDNDGVRRSTIWEWEYIDRLNREDAENWNNRALIAASIRPVRGRVALKLKF